MSSTDCLIRCRVVGAQAALRLVGNWMLLVASFCILLERWLRRIEICPAGCKGPLVMELC